MPVLSSKDLQSHDMQVHAVNSDLSTFAPPAVHLLLEMCQSLAAEMMFDQLLFKCGLRTMLECTQSRCVTTSCNQGVGLGYTRVLGHQYLYIRVFIRIRVYMD